MTECATSGRPGSGSERGFTLLELLVAMGILVFGATTLIGALSVGVGTRRGTEMRARAVLVADQVLHDLEQRVLGQHPLPPDWQTAAELEMPAEASTTLDGFPGMRYSVEFTTSSERPDIVLATVRIAWRDQGEDQGQEFKRLMLRSVPLTQRVEGQRNPR